MTDLLSARALFSLFVMVFVVVHRFSQCFDAILQEPITADSFETFLRDRLLRWRGGVDRQSRGSNASTES